MANKYRAVRCRIGDRTFDSKAEAARYSELMLLERAGVISRLECQPEIPAVINGIKVFVYRPDFIYFREGKRVIEDVKGVRTPVYRLKVKVLRALLNIHVTEVTEVTRDVTRYGRDVTRGAS